MPFDGINWSKTVYNNKCKKIARNPIPELLEDFDLNEINAADAFDSSVNLLSGIMLEAKDSITERLKAGESRTSILRDYSDDVASSNNQMLNVHCENGIWKISIVKALQLLHRDKRRLLNKRLQNNPESFALSFINPQSEVGDEA